jgi:hypothetical protein
MEPPPGERDHPVRFVSYEDLEAFAEWAGLRLPTEAEWEWAARGHGGPTFPWGEDWPRDTSRACWGGKVVNERYETATLPVDALPAGRSWCGCFHMVGNVAEWTSSWFGAYPGNDETSISMGNWVKVIRGGSAADTEMIVLRPACRNWVGGGPDAPPYPENAFPWCGLRLAHAPDPGANRLGPILRRATRARKIAEDHLDLERFLGADTLVEAPGVATGVPLVLELRRRAAVVLIPVRSLLRPEGFEAMRNAWKKPMRMNTTERLLAASQTGRVEWYLGVLHSDLPLEKVERPVETAAERARDEDDRAGSRHRQRPLRTAPGTLAPGTWLLGLWQGRLALLHPDGSLAAFLGPVGRFAPGVEVLDATEGPARERHLAVDPDLDWATIVFDVPLGGKDVPDALRVVVRARLDFDVGSLERAGSWRPDSR